MPALPCCPLPLQHRLLWSQWLALLLALLVWPVQAQSSEACQQQAPVPEMLASIYDMAALTADTLDALDGVRVLIIARSGQDLSRYGLRHSHLAFVLRDETGVWQVVHLLNGCNSDASALFREGLVNFVVDSAQNPAGLRIGILVPPLRTAIAQLLAEPAARARALHQPRYSAIAYPWRTQYQNSNQWILEVTAAAIAEVNENTVLDTREAAITWLQQRGYTPSRLHIGIGKRLGVRFFARNAAVTDHPARERISGNYSVVTVESVFDFLHQSGALEREMTVTLPQSPPSWEELP